MFFHLNVVVCCFANRHTKHIICGHRYRLPFVRKTIDCVHQISPGLWGTKHPAICYVHSVTVSIRHVCRGTVCHVNYESSLRRTWKINVAINEIFYHSILTAIKHVANDSFVIQHDSALAHHACNTVQLLENKTFKLTSVEYVFPQQHRGELH